MVKFSFLILSSILSFAITYAYANEQPLKVINVSALGHFNLEYADVSNANKLVGTTTKGQVSTRPASAFKVFLPFQPQQVVFQHTIGAKLKKEDVVAKLVGTEVHHFFDELTSATSIFNSSKKHLESTAEYAEERTIKTTEWLSINKAYHEAKLNLEHLKHVEKQLKVDGDDVFVVSPSEGVLNLPNKQEHFVFEVYPSSSLAIETRLPSARLSSLSTLSTENQHCILSQHTVEPLIRHYHQKVWSKIPSDCNLTIGERLAITPVYTFSGFLVPIAAVFEISGQSYVAVKKGNNLSLAGVEIANKRGSNYVVTSTALSSIDQVLVSSVSIAQGLFTGLGE